MSGRLTFDLVVATIGRTEELARLLETLAAQSSRDFRVILIDQNDDGRLEPIIERYRDDIDLIHLASKPGLSRARNVGLRSLQADVIAFPDDDCWYPPDLLGRVADFLGRNPSLDGVPRALVPLLESMLAHDPADRPTPEQVAQGCAEVLRRAALTPVEARLALISRTTSTVQPADHGLTPSIEARTNSD